MACPIQSSSSYTPEGAQRPLPFRLCLDFGTLPVGRSSIDRTCWLCSSMSRRYKILRLRIVAGSVLRHALGNWKTSLLSKSRPTHQSYVKSNREKAMLATCHISGKALCPSSHRRYLLWAVRSRHHFRNFSHHRIR
jgi:hypothetical protein